jgi:hypothetical protein
VDRPATAAPPETTAAAPRERGPARDGAAHTPRGDRNPRTGAPTERLGTGATDLPRIERERPYHDAVTSLDLGIGSTGGLGPWKTYGLDGGPSLSAGFQHTGGGSALRLHAGAVADLALVRDDAGPRSGTALAGLLGGSVGGEEARLDVSWTLGGHFLPRRSGAELDEVTAGWLFLTSGPAVALDVRISGPWHAVARGRLDASPLMVGTDHVRLATWSTVGVGLGTEL